MSLVEPARVGTERTKPSSLTRPPLSGTRSRTACDREPKIKYTLLQLDPKHQTFWVYLAGRNPLDSASPTWWSNEAAAIIVCSNYALTLPLAASQVVS